MLNGDAKIAMLDLITFPDLIDRAYNDAIKSAAEHFRLQNARFARIGAPTAQSAETKDVNAIKLVGGWKSRSSAEKYITNGHVAVAVLDISSDEQSRLIRAHEKCTKRMNRYISKQDLTLVSHGNGHSKT